MRLVAGRRWLGLVESSELSPLLTLESPDTSPKSQEELGFSRSVALLKAVVAFQPSEPGHASGHSPQGLSTELELGCHLTLFVFIMHLDFLKWRAARPYRPVPSCTYIQLDRPTRNMRRHEEGVCNTEHTDTQPHWGCRTLERL